MDHALSFDPQRYNKKLAIIVPYRDRQAHLNQFLPHMTAYFQRDKLDRNIAVTIHIIEQVAGKPFNRGKIKNCGFSLVAESCDYVCFHDVDYLPLWADYSWSPLPARLIWYGLTLQENWHRFFGGVTLFDNALFRRVNGFPNCYWAWGFEDTELLLRCNAMDYDFEKRDGTYLSLQHPRAGLDAKGQPTQEARETWGLFKEREGKIAEFMKDDGVSNLNYRLIHKVPLANNAWHFLVDINP